MPTTDHLFYSTEGNAVCECGLSMWQEKHFAGDREAALRCYQQFQERVRKQIWNSLPQKVYDSFMRSEANLAAARQMPKFKTVEEADAWLEAYNPSREMTEIVPRFTSVEQADAWLERQASRERDQLARDVAWTQRYVSP